MIRLGVLLLVELAGVAVLVALPIDLPWHDPASLLHQPEELVAAGIIKVAAVGIAGWLFLSTAAYAAVSPVPRLRRMVARVTSPIVRRAVDTALVASLAMGPAVSAGAAEAPSEPIVVTIDEGDSSGLVVLPPGVFVPAPQPSAPSDDGAEASPPGAPHPFVSRHVAPETDPSDRLPVDRPSTHEVRPGDHLWSIAEQILRERSGRAIVADHEIAPFWRQLIDANLPQLRSGDPDLIYPGEVLTIPEV